MSPSATMGPRWFTGAALLGLLSAIGTQAVTVMHARGSARWASMARTPGWIQNVSHPLDVSVDSYKQTAIVTFAGKKDVEYIDGAVMLGLSIQKHAPGYPMVCLIIADMKLKYQSILSNAGWTLVEVPNWDKEYCGDGCNLEFLGRWHDSFEKINAFRLPFERVLFLDSDTYIFSQRIMELLNQTELPDGHIAMAMDGCKEEYNSGVMLYRPSLDVFVKMLDLVSVGKREEILDQTLVNTVYRGRIIEVPREFNCVDTVGIQPGLKKACDFHCSNDAVVAHFTGHPKPTAAKRRLLELVRRPGAPALACTNTNFGSCAKWSEYYCDIRENSKKLSKDLRYWLHQTGECCHSPFDPSRDRESCKECPSSIRIKGAVEPHSDGLYLKTNIYPSKYNGGKPIYINRGSNMKEMPIYMYYVQKQVLWMIGANYSSNMALTYAGKEAQCPRDAGAWHFYNGSHWGVRHLSVKAEKNKGAPQDTEHVVWNVKRRRWDREEMSQDFDDDKE